MRCNRLPSTTMFSTLYLLVMCIFLIAACSKDDTPASDVPEDSSEEQSEDNNSDDSQDGKDGVFGDVNEDGAVNILVLGSSRSIDSGTAAFSPEATAGELQKILTGDTNVSTTVHVEAEDMYENKQISVGLGSGGDSYDYTFSRHSLTQYYYWPEGYEDRMQNVSGNKDKDWDYVVIAADPYIVATIPGYYALGVHKIASKVAEGNAKTLLLMIWPKEAIAGASMAHFEEVTYRVADGAKTTVAAVPAGLAWDAMPSDKQDAAAVHPSPNGAYLTAAAVYSHIFGASASESGYEYDNTIADSVFESVKEAANKTHYTGKPNVVSPFMACDIQELELNYNHTGTSSENGILGGLRWVIDKSDRSLVKDGTPPINFNYGRANTNFEANKRYKIDASKFDFSLGFPMQDGSVNGNVSMQYGLDKRFSDSENGTDLGTALYMVRNAELPQGRAIPVRTLYVQLREAIPGQSAYRDNWHMHRDLDKAIGGFMYTLLTGDCALGDEPADKSSAAWNSWMAHKIGYETAWNLMYMEAAPPCN